MHVNNSVTLDANRQPDNLMPSPNNLSFCDSPGFTVKIYN